MARPRVLWCVARAIIAAFITIPALGWADTTPDPFSFAPMYNVRRLYPAAAQVAITGIDQPTPVTITNGEYATPHTAWTSGPGLVLNGDVVQVRHVASAGFDAPTTTTLTVGGVSAQFTTRTIKRKALTTGSVRDFNGDGHPDMIWRNEATGNAAVWLLDDAFATTGNFLEGRVLPEGRLDWTPTHFGDFDGDGTTDIVWRNAGSGGTAIWLIADGQIRQGAIVVSDAGWAVTHAADFDGDGKEDFFIYVYYPGSPGVRARIQDGLRPLGGDQELSASQSARAFTDFDGDGRTDKAWLDTASSPQTTWMRYRLAPPGYPAANPPRPLIADPNWRLL